jgi:hypothetical protein
MSRVGRPSLLSRVYRLGGIRILVRSLDLDRDWQEIHGALLDLVSELKDG